MVVFMSWQIIMKANTTQSLFKYSTVILFLFLNLKKKKNTQQWYGTIQILQNSYEDKFHITLGQIFW